MSGHEHVTLAKRRRFLVLAVGIYLLLRWSSYSHVCDRDSGAPCRFVALRRQLDVLITSWVLDASVIVGLVALVVIFRPALRADATRHHETSQPRST